jgi:hypothetical protein
MMAATPAWHAVIEPSPQELGGYRMFMPLSVVWTTLRFQRALSPCWAINDEHGLGLPATPEP